jgi:hypothetical protein
MSLRPPTRLIESLSLVPARTARAGLFVVALLLMVACSDGPTAPQQQGIDRVAAARVMPSVTDARTRLAPAIQNAAIRDRVIHDLDELETALVNGDGQKARFHVRVVATVLTDYRKQQGSVMSDGADVSAIGLALNAVSEVVDGGFVGTAF